MSRLTLTDSTNADWFYPRLCIAHQSGTVTASTSATDFPAVAVSSPLTYTGWKPTASPATIQNDYGSSKTIDYVACYVKDVGASLSITPEYWNGSAWVSFGSSVSVTKAGPYVWMKLTGVSTSKTRLSITYVTTAPVIAFIGSGAATQFPCGIPPGFVPASLNQDDAFTNVFTEGGQVLSSQKLRSSARQDISMDGITPSWVTTNWPAIRALMNTNGMFFAFNPKDSADEVIYGMRGANAPQASYSSSQYMALSFSIEGPEIEL